MTSFTLFIGIAIAAAIVLTAFGILLAVWVERRRYSKQLARHMVDRTRSAAGCRQHLSLTDVDHATLPRPPKSLRSSFSRPASDSSRFYSPSIYQEELRTIPEHALMQDRYSPERTDLTRNSSSWLNLSKANSNRKRKLAKLSVGRTMIRPLSAITEAINTPRAESPGAVEMPERVTPRSTPEKETFRSASRHAVQNSVKSIISVADRYGEKDHSERKEKPASQMRSISSGSIANLPPTVPLPSLPFKFLKDEGGDKSRRLISEADVDKNKPPLLDTSITHLNSGMAALHKSNHFSSFDFGLKASNSPPKFINPDGAVEMPTRRDSRLNSRPASSFMPTGGMQEIDASTWHLPPRARPSIPSWTPSFVSNSEAGSRAASMIDYDQIMGTTGNSSFRNTDSRRVSAISVMSADRLRNSLISVDPASPADSPRKGHKRQNCVRITNLTLIDPKKRLSSQLGCLTEAQEDSAQNSILLLSPAKTQYTQKRASPDPNPALLLPKARSGTLSLRAKQPESMTNRKASAYSIQPTAQSDMVRVIGATPTNTPTDPAESEDQSKQLSLPTIKRNSSKVIYNRIPSPDDKNLDQMSKANSPDESPLAHAPTDPYTCRPVSLNGRRPGPASSLRVKNRNRSRSPRARTASGKQSTSPINKRRMPELDLRRSVAMLQALTASSKSFDVEQMPEAQNGQSSFPGNLSGEQNLSSPTMGDVSPISTELKQRSRSKDFSEQESDRKNRHRCDLGLRDGEEEEEPLLVRPQSGPTNRSKTGSVAKIESQAHRIHKRSPSLIKPSPSTISIWEDESLDGDIHDSSAQSSSPELLTIKRHQSPPKTIIPFSPERQYSERKPVIIPGLTLLAAEQPSAMTDPSARYITAPSSVANSSLPSPIKNPTDMIITPHRPAPPAPTKSSSSLSPLRLNTKPPRSESMQQRLSAFEPQFSPDDVCARSPFQSPTHSPERAPTVLHNEKIRSQEKAKTYLTLSSHDPKVQNVSAEVSGTEIAERMRSAASSSQRIYNSNLKPSIAASQIQAADYAMQHSRARSTVRVVQPSTQSTVHVSPKPTSATRMRSRTFSSAVPGHLMTVTSTDVPSNAKVHNKPARLQKKQRPVDGRNRATSLSVITNGVGDVKARGEAVSPRRAGRMKMEAGVGLGLSFDEKGWAI